MIDMDWLPDLRDDSHIDKWCDAAVQIKSHYQDLLLYDFESNVANFKAYMHRVAHFGVLDQGKDEGFDEAEEAYNELVDTYPLDPKFFKDSIGVYRQYMVHFCIELLKANTAIKTGFTENAWTYLLRASNYKGQAEGYYEGVNPVENKSRSGKKGGISKEKNKQQAVRNACMQHLKNDCPSGGWSSTSVAIAAVAPTVEKMIRKQREEVDVHALLYAWLNGDQEVQQAGGFKMPCAKE